MIKFKRMLSGVLAILLIIESVDSFPAREVMEDNDHVGEEWIDGLTSEDSSNVSKVRST